MCKYPVNFLKIFAFFLLIDSSISAQHKLTQYVHEGWLNSDGLPSNGVLRITQSEDQFLWLGTLDGLAAFDGYEFYLTSFPDQIKLADTRVVDIQAIGKKLLFCTPKHVFLKEGSEITHLLEIPEKTDIIGFSKTPDQRVWLLTHAHIYEYEARLNTFSKLEFNTPFDIQGLLFNDDSFYTFGYSSQIRLYEYPSLKTIRSFSIPDGEISDILWLNENELLIGTEKRLLRYSIRNYQFKEIFLDGNQTREETPIKKLLRDSSGNIWIGTRRGLFRLNDYGIEHFTADDGLTHNDVRSLFEDIEGNIWIGTYRGGLNRMYAGAVRSFSQIEGLSSKVVYATGELNDGSILIAGFGGLDIISKNKVNPNPFPSTKGALIRTFDIDDDRNIWIGTYGSGIQKISAHSGSTSFLSTKNGLSSDIVRSIHIAENGKIYIGTRNGLDVIDGSTFSHYSTGEINHVNSYDETVFICSDGNGFEVLFNGELTSFRTGEGLSSNIALSNLPRFNDHVWVGTANGLNLYYKGKFYHGRGAGSFYDVSVSQIVYYNDHLWLGTALGIYRVKEDELLSFLLNQSGLPESLHFSTSEGMRNITATAPATAHMDRFKNIWFPTLNGVAVINADNPQINLVNPVPRVVSVQLDGSTIKDHNNLVVPSDVNRLEFFYTSPSFVSPSFSTFKYQLKGFDDDWIPSGNKRSAVYTNLQKGSYVFEVKAISRAGVPSLKSYKVEFQKKPRIWEMLIFQVATLLLLVVLIFGAARYRVYRLKEQSRKLQRIVRERTSELEKENAERLEAERRLIESEKMAALGSLVAGVAHEINTPLGSAVTAASTINTRSKDFLNTVQNGKLTKSYLNQSVEMIKEGSEILLKNAERAAELIRSFKQVAVDQTSEQRRSFDINEYLHEVLLSLKPRLKKTSVTLNIDCPEDLIIDSYPGFFSQIISNLVMNSIIHGFDDGKKTGLITIKVAELNGDIRMEFADNGNGMPEEVRTHVFDPFFTTKPGRGGTGLGMHIIYNIIHQKLHGEINCKSTIGEGTIFTIRLPRKLK